MEEAFAICTTCGREIARDIYKPEQDHEASGVVAGIAALHLAGNPDHEIAYGRESVDDADARRATERDDAGRRDREAFDAHAQRTAEAAQRRAVEASTVTPAPFEPMLIRRDP